MEYDACVWNVEYTDEFGSWWETLERAEERASRAIIELLTEQGPQLPFPHSSQIQGSRHGQMRELRVQSRGKPIRILYAFDPRRTAILLIGGSKAGNDRFYVEHVAAADNLYDNYIEELRREGLIK